MLDSLATDPAFFKLLSDSYFKFVGRPLVEHPHLKADAAQWLYENAPFCVVAHNNENDPQFIYANKSAQMCFEYDWTEITNLRSRFSAPPLNRNERQQLLETVHKHGYVSGYRGLRIAKSGRRFWIENVTTWNLIDEMGASVGQAATYRRWKDA